jgi:predicted NBD/HSP70 family sugar kinase
MRKILVIDVGGTNVKVRAPGMKEAVKIPSGNRMTGAAMVAAVRRAARGWKYDAVSIGFPGPVIGGRAAAEPRNLGRGWRGVDFARAFGKPVRLLNDAAMQALGSYRGGRMLFLGLGTGLGCAMVLDGVVEPTEIAHLPYRKGRTYEDYVGLRGLLRLGRKKWEKHVHRVVEELSRALLADDVVLGGGNAKKLERLPPGSRLGSNEFAFVGGIRMWEGEGRRRRASPRSSRKEV